MIAVTIASFCILEFFGIMYTINCSKNEHSTKCKKAQDSIMMALIVFDLIFNILTFIVLIMAMHKVK